MIDIIIVSMKIQTQDLRIRFVAKLGAMGKYQKDGEDKFHIIIPRGYIEQLRSLKGKQVRVEIDDEI
jgi:hypothetical protein